MASYLLHIGGEPVGFTANTPEAFLDAWRDVHRYPDRDEDAWMKTAAALACDWSGKPVRYDTLENFTNDMIRHGMLEEVHA